MCCLARQNLGHTNLAPVIKCVTHCSGYHHNTQAAEEQLQAPVLECRILLILSVCCAASRRAITSTCAGMRNLLLIPSLCCAGSRRATARPAAAFCSSLTCLCSAVGSDDSSPAAHCYPGGIRGCPSGSTGTTGLPTFDSFLHLCCLHDQSRFTFRITVTLTMMLPLYSWRCCQCCCRLYFITSVEAAKQLVACQKDSVQQIANTYLVH